MPRVREEFRLERRSEMKTPCPLDTTTARFENRLVSCRSKRARSFDRSSAFVRVLDAFVGATIPQFEMGRELVGCDRIGGSR
jgi:hypothetical protein